MTEIQKTKLAELIKIGGELFAAESKCQYGSDELKAAKMASFKNDQLIAAVHAEIAADAKKAEIAEMEAKRLIPAANFEAAVLARSTAKGDAKQAAEDAYLAAKDALHNVLLSGVPKVRTATTAEGHTGEAKGAKSADIVANFIAMKALGTMTDAQIKKAIVAGTEKYPDGHAIGTVGSAILLYEEQSGLKPAKTPKA